ERGLQDISLSSGRFCAIRIAQKRADEDPQHVRAPALFHERDRAPNPARDRLRYPRLFLYATFDRLGLRAHPEDFEAAAKALLRDSTGFGGSDIGRVQSPGPDAMKCAGG